MNPTNLMSWFNEFVEEYRKNMDNLKDYFYLVDLCTTKGNYA
jgi:hypothetical protein